MIKDLVLLGIWALCVSPAQAGVMQDYMGLCLWRVNGANSWEQIYGDTAGDLTGAQECFDRVSAAMPVGKRGELRFEGDSIHLTMGIFKDWRSHSSSCLINYFGGDNPDPSAPWSDRWEHEQGFGAWFFRATHSRSLNELAHYHGNGWNSLNTSGYTPESWYGFSSSPDASRCVANAGALIGRGTYWLRPGQLSPSSWLFYKFAPDSHQDLDLADIYSDALTYPLPLARSPRSGYVPRSVVRAVRFVFEDGKGEVSANGTLVVDSAGLHSLLVSEGLNYPKP